MRIQEGHTWMFLQEVLLVARSVVALGDYAGAEASLTGGVLAIIAADSLVNPSVMA